MQIGIKKKPMKYGCGKEPQIYSNDIETSW